MRMLFLLSLPASLSRTPLLTAYMAKLLIQRINKIVKQRRNWYTKREQGRALVAKRKSTKLINPLPLNAGRLLSP